MNDRYRAFQANPQHRERLLNLAELHQKSADAERQKVNENELKDELEINSGRDNETA